METCQLSQQSEDRTFRTSRIIDLSPPLSMTENILKGTYLNHKTKDSIKNFGRQCKTEEQFLNLKQKCNSEVHPKGDVDFQITSNHVHARTHTEETLHPSSFTVNFK